MPFCSACGTALESGVRFCTQCGKSVAANVPVSAQQVVYSPQPVSAPQQDARPVYMVLSVSKKDGLLSKPGYLVFYPDCAVFAYLTKELQNAENERLRAQLKAEGKGFFQSSAAMMSMWSSYGERYYSLTREDVVRQAAENFAVYYMQVSKCSFDTFNSSSYSDDTRVGGTISFHTDAGKLRFSHRYTDSNGNIKGVLQGLFGQRLRYSVAGGGLINIRFSSNKQGFI